MDGVFGEKLVETDSACDVPDLHELSVVVDHLDAAADEEEFVGGGVFEDVLEPGPGLVVEYTVGVFVRSDI